MNEVVTAIILVPVTISIPSSKIGTKGTQLTSRPKFIIVEDNVEVQIALCLPNSIILSALNLLSLFILSLITYNKSFQIAMPEEMSTDPPKYTLQPFSASFHSHALFSITPNYFIKTDINNQEIRT